METISGSLTDPSLRARTSYESANVRWWFDGGGDAALQGWRNGLVLAEALGDLRLRIEGHKLMGMALLNLGDLPGAEAQLVQLSKLASELASLRDESRTTFLLGVVKYHLGELEDAETLSAQALEWTERLGEIFYRLQSFRTLALCALRRADYVLAETHMREALPLAESVRGPLGIDTYRCLVDALIGQARIDEARAVAETALRGVSEEDIYSRAAGQLIRARLATVDGLYAEACSCFDEACALLDEQRLPLDLGEGRLAYGRALRQLGDTGGAELQLRGAREDLVGLGARGLVDQIDRELAEIDEGAGQAGPLVSL
jgi:tetratricopeptide (TPR) repeat protein